MLIPFFKQKQGSGARLTQGFDGKYYLKPSAQVWRFSGKPNGYDLGKVIKPRTTFAMKKEQHPSCPSHKPGKDDQEAEVQRLKHNNKKGDRLRREPITQRVVS